MKEESILIFNMTKKNHLCFVESGCREGWAQLGYTYNYSDFNKHIYACVSWGVIF